MKLRDTKINVFLRETEKPRGNPSKATQTDFKAIGKRANAFFPYEAKKAAAALFSRTASQFPSRPIILCSVSVRCLSEGYTKVRHAANEATTKQRRGTFSLSRT